MWKIWQDKNIRKGHSEEENYQKDLQRENYLDSQIRNMTKNIGKDQRGIGDSEKESDQGEKIETIIEKKEIGEEKSGVKEWTEKNNNEIGNMVDLYYKLQKKFLGTRKLKREVVS